jgi:hypothetical protein
MYNEDVEVLHEEIIVHPTAERRGNRLSGEACIIGEVVIDGKTYRFEKVVSVSFVEVLNGRLTPVAADEGTRG